MTRTQMALLLGLMSAGADSRKVDEAAVTSWHEIVGDLDFADARAAVIAWYRTQTARIMPADLRNTVRSIRDERNRLENPAEPRALPGRFEADTIRDQRLRAGIEQCRLVLAPILAARTQPDPEEFLTESDRIHFRARQRAHADRMDARFRGRA